MAKRTTIPDKVQRVRDCFKFAAEAEHKQREREVADLKFAALDHWPAEIKAMRSGQPAQGGMPPVPPRPCLVVDMLGQMIRQVKNQQRNARWAVDVTPKSEGASAETAELLQGVIRQIEYDSTAQVARSAAFERAVTCGRGFYRVLIDYANDGDFDLDIQIERILNQANVYLDPTAEQPDWSDGKWAIIMTTLTHEAYKDQFPDSDLAKADSLESLRSIGDEDDGWILTGPDGKDSIRIAEYFYVEETPRKLHLMGDGKVIDDATLQAMPKKAQAFKTGTRTVYDRSVKWCKVNGREVLDEQDWPGRYIPIIPVLGEELIVPDADDLRRYQGIVRPAREPQFAYDVMVSAQVEAIGLATKAPYIAYIETLEGFEPWWQQSATRAFPYLPIKMARDGAGAALPPPKRNVEEPAIQAITQSASLFQNAIKSATGIFDPSLGNLSPQERSGRAIMALQKQAEVGVSNFLDNLARSITYEGKILCDLIPKVYTRPGRIARMITGNDETQSVLVNQPFIKGENGQPQPVAEGTEGATTYELKPDAEFAVTVKVGKSFDTAREEAATSMGEILAGQPQLLQLVGDIYFGTQDFAGAKQLAERFKLLLPPQVQQAESGDKPSIQQMQQQMQQAMQMVEMLTKELQAKTQVIETDQIKAEQQLAIATAKANTDAEIRINELAVEERIKLRELETKERIEMAKLGQGWAVARAEIEQDLLHQHNEAQQAEADRAESSAQADLDRQAERDEAEQGRAFESEQAEREASRPESGA